jgi:hypothetical protein
MAHSAGAEDLDDVLGTRRVVRFSFVQEMFHRMGIVVSK